MVDHKILLGLTWVFIGIVLDMLVIVSKAVNLVGIATLHLGTLIILFMMVKNDRE